MCVHNLIYIHNKETTKRVFKEELENIELTDADNKIVIYSESLVTNSTYSE